MCGQVKLQDGEPGMSATMRLDINDTDENLMTLNSDDEQNDANNDMTT